MLITEGALFCFKNAISTDSTAMSSVNIYLDDFKFILCTFY